MPNQHSLPDSAEQTGKTGKQLQPYFNKEFIIKHTLWFALISIATIAGIFFYNNTGDTFNALQHIKLKFILICLVMLFADLMMGSWRNHIYAQKLKPGLSHWVSFKANVVNMFMGAVTPAHGGAGPAQMYVYMRHGLSFSDAFAITLINFGATLIFMPLAGFTAILLMNPEYVGGIIPSLLKYTFTFFSIFLVAFLLAFWKPVWVGVIIKKIAVGLSKIFPGRRPGLMGWAERSEKNIAEYQQTCSIILKKNPLLFPLSIIITIVMYLNKYCMQYVILLGLGVQADLLQVISIQVLIQFMIYFIPTPGGSGFAEISISVLFGKIVPAGILSLFTLLQRSFLLFFPAMLGAYFLLKFLHKQAMEKKIAGNRQSV
ncbi:MAG: flippase-like domain-containing protein [Ferruginibacter sp.]|nr:flippase-like domain-containing protein [Ferruginibacter sp.]